jgi:septum formation protein
MRRLILASGSPRRKTILTDAGFLPEVIPLDVDESFPADMDVRKVASFLAEIKMEAALGRFPQDKVMVTADTVVVLEGEIIGKPGDRKEAIGMLQNLSGKVHEVNTAVCIALGGDIHKVEAWTEVSLLPVSLDEIEYYVDQHKPYDKAGGYAIQEWIGLNKIDRISGDYYNVVGFPMSGVYPVLMELLHE